MGIRRDYEITADTIECEPVNGGGMLLHVYRDKKIVALAIANGWELLGMKWIDEDKK